MVPHPKRYLNTSGEYRGEPDGKLSVLGWDDNLKKYMVYLTTDSKWGHFSYTTYLTPEELDRDYWVQGRGANSPKCECGADLLGHPGHSYWCALFEENT